MYVKFPKQIFYNEKIASQDLLFPCMIFLLRYKSNLDEINTTIGCILNEFDINPIPRNVDKIKQCLSVLSDEGIILLDTKVDKINTPIKLTFPKLTPWIAVHDFEINVISELVKNPKASFKIGNLFTAIKHTAHTVNHSNNMYSSITKGYTLLSLWSGIESKTTISKYVNLLGDTDILNVKQTTVKRDVNGKESWNTTNEYSFKQIETKSQIPIDTDLE